MTSRSYDGSGYQSRGRLSPAALGGVVIVHVGLGAAIVSMTAIGIFEPAPSKPIITYNIPVESKPDPTPPKARPETRETRITAPGPTIELTRPPTTDFVPTEMIAIDGGSGGIAPVPTPILTPDPAPPVLVQARADSRFARDFQPAYPAAMLRLQKEGDVTVRVQIGVDGRVVDVALVSTADPTFFEAARRQALSRWRFLPATRDGVPVASERVMTVHFNITD